MSTFTPTVREIDPPPPDYLAGAVLRSLHRSIDGRRWWGVVRSVVVGGLTFGVGPLLFWPLRFRDYVIAEQQQLWHAAEWMRLQTGSPHATVLRDQSERLRFRTPLWVISLICAGLIVALFWPHFARMPFDLRQLLNATYQYDRRLLGYEPLFRGWTVGLALAYAFHWLQVKWHNADVREWVESFNRVAADEGVSPIEPPQVGWGLRPLWVLGGVVLLAFNAHWGIPMMLAGALHSRYMNDAGRKLRSDLAYRVRAMLSRRRPVMDLPMPVQMKRTCDSPSCRAPLPIAATFCPRCGKRNWVESRRHEDTKNLPTEDTEN